MKLALARHDCQALHKRPHLSGDEIWNRGAHHEYLQSEAGGGEAAAVCAAGGFQVPHPDLQGE